MFSLINFYGEGLVEQVLSQAVLPHLLQSVVTVVVLSMVAELHDSSPQQFFMASQEVSEIEVSSSAIADAFKIDFNMVLFDL